MNVDRRRDIASHAEFTLSPLLCYAVCFTGGDAEVLAQLEERTKLSKDSLFRKKKELQRLITDFDEDYRRYEQVRVDSENLFVTVLSSANTFLLHRTWIWIYLL